MTPAGAVVLWEVCHSGKTSAIKQIWSDPEALRAAVTQPIGSAFVIQQRPNRLAPDRKIDGDLRQCGDLQPGGGSSDYSSASGSSGSSGSDLSILRQSGGLGIIMEELRSWLTRQRWMILREECWRGGQTKVTALAPSGQMWAFWGRSQQIVGWQAVY